MLTKKVLALLVTAMVISVILITSLGTTILANVDGYGYQEPYLSSGDCYPNGRGF
jgi:hypothetical protein